MTAIQPVQAQVPPPYGYLATAGWVVPAGIASLPVSALALYIWYPDRLASGRKTAHGPIAATTPPPGHPMRWPINSMRAAMARAEIAAPAKHLGAEFTRTLVDSLVVMRPARPA